MPGCFDAHLGRGDVTHPAFLGQNNTYRDLNPFNTCFFLAALSPEELQLLSTHEAAWESLHNLPLLVAVPEFVFVIEFKLEVAR